MMSMRSVGRGARISAIVLAVALVAGLATSVQASLIVSEPFNYTVGTDNLNGQGAAGGGWSGAWTAAGTYDVFTSGLTWGGTYSPAASGNGAQQNGSNNGTTSRSFTTALSSGTYYISWLISDTNPAATSGWFGFLLKGSSSNVYIGDDGSSVKSWQIQHSGVSSAGTIATNTTQLLVAKLEFNVNSGTNERITLYVDPSNLNSEPGSYMVQRAAANMGNFTGIGFDCAQYSSNVVKFDEIRVGTAWVDVVPEPATLALLVLGGFGLLARRHRRA